MIEKGIITSIEESRQVVSIPARIRRTLTAISHFESVRAGGKSGLHVISRRALREFWEKHPEAKDPLLAWHKVTKKARWRSLTDARLDFPHADPVGHCTVFNVKGNAYRLITVIKYQKQRVYILHVLTHPQYDKGRWKNDCDC